VLVKRLATLLPAVTFAALLVPIWQGNGVTPLLKGLAAAVLATAAVSPFAGLLLIALLLPVATPLQVFSGAPMTGAQVAEMLLLPFLVASGIRLGTGANIPATRLGWPAMVFGTMLVVSCVVQLGVDQQATAIAPNFFALMGTHVTTKYFSDFSAFPPLHLATSWVEALLLAVTAERLLRQQPARRTAAVHVLLSGAAMAACFSVFRLVQASARSAEPWASAIAFLRTLRVSPHFPDVNAAGSYFVLFAVPAIWLLLKHRSLWHLPASILSSLGLWLTHSRAAHVAALAAVAGAWTVDRRPRRLTLLAGLAVIAILIGYAISYQGDRQPGAFIALDARMEMARVGLRVAGIHPIFGVGPGQFKAASAPFVSPAIAELSIGPSGENAHNQFIQVLAEFGTVGLLPFLWVLAAPLTPAVASVARRTGSPELVALTWGVLAFLISSLLGHPLLIVQVLVLFMLTLGVTAGLVADPPVAIRPWGKWLVAAALAVLCVSIPFRVDSRRRAAELDNVIVGSTSVRGTVDDVRFRQVEPRSVFFVATAVKSVTMPLRRAPESTEPCRVTVTIDGQPVSDIAPTSDAWLKLDLPLLPPARPRASRAIELKVLDSGCTLMVGTIVKKMD
jgi:O-antigen ligase